MDKLYSNGAAGGFTWKPGASGLTKWDGPKAQPEAGTIFVAGTVSSADNTIYVQLTPDDVVSDIKSFTLQDSKLNTLPVEVTLTPYKDLMTRSAGNGIYTVGIATQEISSSDYKAMEKLIGREAAASIGSTASGEGNVAYSLVADGVFRSAYKAGVNNAFEAFTDPTANAASAFTGLEATTNYLLIGKAATVTFTNPESLYDMYFAASADMVSLYGLEFDNEKHTITVTKEPDVATTGGDVKFSVYYLSVSGTVAKADYTIAVSTDRGSSALSLQTVDVSQDESFGFALSAAGISTVTWRQNVALTNTTYELFTDAKCTTNEDVTSATVLDSDGSKALNASIVDASGKATDDASKAAGVVVTIDNENATNGLSLDKTYYLKVIFKNGDSKALNSAVLPVKFVAPAMKDLFTVGQYLNADGESINAYLNTTYTDPKVDLKRFFLKYYDKAVTVAASTTDAPVTVKGTTYSSSQLLTVSGTTFGTATAALKSQKTSPDDLKYAATDTENGGWAREYGYGQALTITVTSAKYLNWVRTVAADKVYSFKLRILSPIMEGSVKSADGKSIISVAANSVEGGKITDTMIKGYDYNNNPYSIVYDKATGAEDPQSTGTYNYTVNGWSNEQIKTVAADAESAKKYLTVSLKEGTPKALTGTTETGGVVSEKGYILVKGTSTSGGDVEDTFNVNITDAWGYTKSFPVAVKVTVSK